MSVTWRIFMIQGNSGFNIDTAIEAFKTANTQNKAIEIIKGRFCVKDTQDDSSIKEIDDFVQKQILSDDLSNLGEKQALLVKEIEIYYKGLETHYKKEVDKTRTVIKDSPITEASKSNSEKVNTLYTQIANTSKQLNQKSSVIQQNLIKRKAEYQAKRQKILNIFLEVSQRHSHLDKATLNFGEVTTLEKRLVNLGLKDADADAEIQALSNKVKGIYTVVRAQSAASYVDNLLYQVLFEGDFSSGIHTDEDIDGLIRIGQNRKNFLDYAFELEILFQQRETPAFANSLKSLTTEIQKNIQLLENPNSDKIISVKDKTSFVLPGGWARTGNPHYLSYEIRKEGEDYYFLVHNRGDLTTQFPELHNNISFKDNHSGKTYSKTTACIKTTKEALMDGVFIQKLINNYINPNFNVKQTYIDIQDHFIKSGKGTVVQSKTEKELEKIFNQMSTCSAKEKEVLNARALELMKNDNYFQSQQLIGSCAESNYATSEIEISSSHTLHCVEKYMLAHMVNKAAGRILNPSDADAKINLVIIKKHVDQRIDLLKQKIEGMSAGVKGRSPTIFKDAFLFKQSLTEAEKKPFIEGLQSGKLKLRYLPKFLKNDPEIVLAAVNKNGLDLQYASEALRKDNTLVLAAKKQNPVSLIYASSNLKESLPISSAEKIKFLEAIQSGKVTLKSLPKSLCGDRDIVLAAVVKDGLALQYASKELQKDSEIVLGSLRNNINALAYVSKDFIISESDNLGFYEVLSEAIKNDLIKFDDVESLVSDNASIMESFITSNPIYYLSISKRLTSDKRLLEETIKKGFPALSHASDSLQALVDPELIVANEALLGSKTFSDLSDTFKADKVYLKALVMIAPENFRLLPEELKADKEFVKEIIVKHSHLYLYDLPAVLKYDESFMQEIRILNPDIVGLESLFAPQDLI